MNLDEIPTPETDALVPTQGNKQTMLQYIETLEAHARDIERRLALLTEHVGLCHDEIGESRDSDTSELHLFFRREADNDKRRMIDAVNIIDLESRLTVSRDALWKVYETSSSPLLRRVARKTLTQTAPKP